MYDITKRKTFDHIEDWLEEAKIHIEPHKAVFHIIGHKCDMSEERAVTTREGQQFAEFHGLKFLETSAVTGQNIEEAFVGITKEIYEQLEEGELSVEEGWEGIKNGYARPRETLTLMEGEPEGGGCC